MISWVAMASGDDLLFLAGGSEEPTSASIVFRAGFARGGTNQPQHSWVDAGFSAIEPSRNRCGPAPSDDPRSYSVLRCARRAFSSVITLPQSGSLLRDKFFVNKFCCLITVLKSVFDKCFCF